MSSILFFGLMSLAHAILVSLAGCPKSGYDLAKAFDGSVGFFWKATHQQIYRELTKLEERGWLAAQIVAQESRPDKKLYSLTGEGMDRLKAWLHEPCDLAAVKEELLLKVFAGHLVKPQAIAREIDRHRQLHRDRLAIYRDIEEQYFSDPKSLSKEGKFHYLTLLSGIGYETAWIAWCEEAIAQLNSDLV